MASFFGSGVSGRFGEIWSNRFTSFRAGAERERGREREGEREGDIPHGGAEPGLLEDLKFGGPALRLSAPWEGPAAASSRAYPYTFEPPSGHTANGRPPSGELMEKYGPSDASARGAQEFARKTKTGAEVRSQVQAVIEGTAGLQRPRVVWKLGIAYAVSVLIVILLSLAGQIVVQYAVTRSYRDSELVNVAGRQRMLSQMISKDSLAIQLHLLTGQDASYYWGELRSKLPIWRQSQSDIRYGNKTLGLSRASKGSIVKAFEVQEPYFFAMRGAAERILELNEQTITNTSEEYSVLKSQVEVILANEKFFWTMQDGITKQFEKLSRSHLEFVLIVSWVLHALVIVALLLEGAFLFLPALRKIQVLIDERFRLIRRALEAEAESGGVSLLMLSYMRGELVSALGVVSQNLAALRGLLTPHAERALLHDFVLDGIRLDCRGALEDLAESDLCLALARTVLADVASAAQLAAGRMALAVDYADVVGLVQQVVRLSKRKAYPGVSVDVDIDNTIMEDPVYQVDKHRLQQVLINLLNDAFQVTLTGNVKMRVLAVEGRDLLHFEVEDGGGGLSLEEQATIFQPLLVGESRAEGKGKDVQQSLNRYFVKMLVELQGGVVNYEIKEGEGTCFWFEIPCHRGGPLGLQVVEDDQTPEDGRMSALAVKDSSMSSIYAREYVGGLSSHHHHLYGSPSQDQDQEEDWARKPSEVNGGDHAV